MVTADGVAKVGLFSFGRIISAIPAAATLTASAGPLLPFRWMSPELLLNNKPNTESDMWAMGCVGFWVRQNSSFLSYLTTLTHPYIRQDLNGSTPLRRPPPGRLCRCRQCTRSPARRPLPHRLCRHAWRTHDRSTSVELDYQRDLEHDLSVLDC